MKESRSASRNDEKKSPANSILISALIKYKWLRIVLPTLIIIAFIIVGISTSSYTSSRIVQLGLRNIGELTTQAGYFTNVQVIKDSVDLYGWTLPLTTSKYIFSYDGIVKAGIDFDDIDVSTNEITKTITVKLPEATIFSLEINPDSLEIYDESKSIFTPLELADINNSLSALKEDVERQAINNGILESAYNNSKLLVESMLSKTMDSKTYTIVFA